MSTADTLMINDLFNFKREESKLSSNIYHDYTVRNLNTNNAKNVLSDLRTFASAKS